jgi:hypothetical protein
VRAALDGKHPRLVGLEADFGDVPALQLKRLVVACDRDWMALPIDAGELEREFVILVDDNLARRKQKTMTSQRPVWSGLLRA